MTLDLDAAAPRSSAEALDQRLAGRALARGRGPAWKDLVVQLYSRDPVETGVVVPAVAEPLIVWVLSGAAVVEERELGGSWAANTVRVGDFFLTTSTTPYELRWRSTHPSEPFEVMHLYLGLEILRRAAEDVDGPGASLALREVSGERDAVLSHLLEPLRLELAQEGRPSALLVQGLAQALAVHLRRNYADRAQPARRPSALPAYRLRRVIEAMEERLAEPFSLSTLAQAAAMSPFHFSRLFKAATGLSPSRYFIRLRMARARRLLRETQASIIEIGLEVGYASPSHFAQIFRREVGVTPSDYRA
ncbi:helix-turn-helix domain-containing protein [Caulobacter sp. CCNWLY153]|uniref:AraC family transcriptional regulator n=1 Tax=Caulobacter radicis TaxID=2172650 RepID=A0A2T9JM61_9CAUL|nr:helix-turn-helix domain-containing protein [Caulobacter radicis]PVM84785.1 AraC family transcriptional regulator [Caulobacter radicis]